MGKRVYELAKELNVEAKQILQRLRDAGIVVKDHLASLSKEEEDKARKLFETPKAGDVLVKKMDGGRVVRRRAGGTVELGAAPTGTTPAVPAAPVAVAVEAVSEPAVESEEPAPVVVESEEPAPVVVEPEPDVVIETVPEPVVVAPVETAAVAAPVPVVSPLPPVINPPLPPRDPTMGSAVISRPSHTAAAAAAAAAAVTPAPQHPVQGPAGAPGAVKPAGDIKTLAEAPDRKGKAKQLVYDRRRDVLSLRDFMATPEDEAERVESRPQQRRKKVVQRSRRSMKTILTMPKEQKRVIRIDGDAIQVGELAHHMSVKGTEVVRKLMALGVMASVNQSIDFDTAAVIAGEFGFTCEKVGFDPAMYLDEQPDGDLDMKSRSPVVTIMGHVDHGKTTLLDRIRKSHVAEGEAGGITQHIGAYKVKAGSGDIVFLDTPGHEAFTAMRARGAKSTDIVILVVAADDGVMAQTKEAIAHAREANVPIIVAVNKIDKSDARPERVRKELANEGILSEEWGGENIFCEISAKKGEGIEALLDAVLLQAEVLELKANPDKAGRGVVLESQLHPQLGPVATVLIQAGTLKVGDVAIAGLAHGRVRIMTDDQGKPCPSAGPSTPVRVAGLDMVPNAGDVFVVLPDEKKAREIAEWQMEQIKRTRAASGPARVSLEDFYTLVQSGETKELKVVLRSDVQGSLGALTESVSKLKHPEISLKIIHAAVGNINESDVNLSIASSAVIVGFNVTVDPKAQSLADQEKIDIRRYSVIYDVIDDLRKAMEGLLTPKMVAKLVGRADIRQVFSVSKVGKIAGAFVSFGHVIRSAEVRVIRGKETLFTGKLGSLKRFKDDAREVKQGLECGVAVDGFEGIEPGDTLEFYEYEQVRESLGV